MRWQFWQSSNSNGMPVEVKGALESQFKLEPQAIEKLAVLKKSGQFAGRPVRFILIYEPNLVGTTAASQLKYEQVEKGEWRKALLFDGRIEKTGQIYLADRRPKTTAH